MPSRRTGALRVLATLGMVLIASVASGVDYTRTGRVDQVVVKDDGYAYIKLVGVTYMCNNGSYGSARIPLKNDYGRAMYKIALGAKLSNKSVRANTRQYNDYCRVMHLRNQKEDGSY